MDYLKVSDNRRFLTHEDGSPFFWLGDTAWELFHRLSLDEATVYLEKRASQGFNVVQAVALAELDGLTTPNANGHVPLLPGPAGDYSEAEPDLRTDENYWTDVDRIIDLAEARGIYIALLPTWGSWINNLGKDTPEIFNATNAKSYGTFIAKRYGHRPSIIWVLGGDRTFHTRKHFDIQQSFAEAICEHADPRQLITFHPCGLASSSKYVHDEAWLDFNMVQSCHTVAHYPNYDLIAKDYARRPIKPTLDAEPRYEDHPINFDPTHGYFDAWDVRQAIYWGILAGGLGCTYGHHSVWSMNATPSSYFPLTWKQALDRPGAWQMRHVRTLMDSVDFQTGVPAQHLLQDPLNGANHVAVSQGNNYILAYSPNGLPFSLDLPHTSYSIQWFDPRTGTLSQQELATQSQTPPTTGRGEDWVALLRYR